MRLAKDGIREMVLATLLLGGGSALALALCWPAWYGWAAAAPLWVVWLWVLWFFRDPDRPVPTEPGLFVSPADGRVTDITPVGADGPLGQPGVKIGVFMSIFDVHVNRAPCEATVTGVDYRAGRYLDARDPRASEANESMTVKALYEANGQAAPVVWRQVAGLVARRIVCRLAPGQRVSRGERFGLIKFGSRGELYLPEQLQAKICVRVGQKVKAGVTVLARIAEPQERP